MVQTPKILSSDYHQCANEQAHIVSKTALLLEKHIMNGLCSTRSILHAQINAETNK